MLFLLLTLIQTPAFAQPTEDSSCAKEGLSAIYGAERSYREEYKSYSDSFSDIGYEHVKGQCDSWEESVRIFNGGKEFLATFTQPSSGETWNINEKKELRQEYKGSEKR